jgi:hypothetical protein
MGEVATDTTKHRRKIIADKRDPLQRIITVAPEGDRMQGHVTVRVTTRADGACEIRCMVLLLLLLLLLLCCCVVVAWHCHWFCMVNCCGGFVANLRLFHESPGKCQEGAMEIEGACAPVVIHCDATQTEEKKMAERERQRRGEVPTEKDVNPKFLEGMDSPEVLIGTSKNGSMDQEIFFYCCRHFVASLKAIEKACETFRRLGRNTNTGCFNEMFSVGWRMFLLAERKDVTCACERAGVWPLDPCADAWTGAIDGLGLGNENVPLSRARLSQLKKRCPS